MAKPIVLITGSSGLLGQAVAERLSSDYTVVGLDIAEPESEEWLDDLLYLDVTSDMSVRRALETVRSEHGDRISAVVHLAAFYDFSGEESEEYDRVTVQGTARLLRVLDDFEVERFVFTSTMLVHAPVEPGERISEESPLGAKWPYPQSKIGTERLIAGHRPEIPHTLLRLAGVYDERGTQPTLVHQIQRIYENDFKSFFFPGDSEAGQTLVHLEDAVDAIDRTIARRTGLGDGPILIGEPDPMGYAELQDRIGELLFGAEWPTVRVPETLAKAATWIEDKASDDSFIKPYMIEMADDHYALDIGRARDRLGWSPSHRLAAELPAIIEGLQDDPSAWYGANGLAEPDTSTLETARSS